jgi:hypothetical protein
MLFKYYIKIINIMYKKIQYDDIGYLIIYEYNSVINILIILYLHLMMTRVKNLIQEENITNI